VVLLKLPMHMQMSSRLKHMQVRVGKPGSASAPEPPFLQLARSRAH
jgi:hypothetical protein